MSKICKEIHELFNRHDRLQFPFQDSEIPKNGIYVLFEKGECAHGGDRIVRIGTHTGVNQLPARLKQHFIKENKDRSIFRKNIGRALLARSVDPFLNEWEYDLTSWETREIYSTIEYKQKLKIVEENVTSYIQQSFSFIVFKLTSKQERLSWESKIISTVSLCKDCNASPQWLGLSSPKAKIRESGLWLVNELYKKPLNEGDLENLREILLR
jgi:hypothetical protein